MASGYEEQIANFLYEKLNNKIGVFAMMGNLYAESGLRPNNLQNSFETSLGMSDTEYTNAVDSGTYSKDSFVHDSAGYGLAQWTYWSRKQNMYEYYKDGNYASIGCIELALDFLWWELNNSFKDVVEVLKTSNSLREASDKVLHDFESPADQSVTIEEKRYNYSKDLYDKYVDSLGAGSGSEGSENPPQVHKFMKLLLMAMAIDD